MSNLVAAYGALGVDENSGATTRGNFLTYHKLGTWNSSSDIQISSDLIIALALVNSGLEL